MDERPPPPPFSDGRPALQPLAFHHSGSPPRSPAGRSASSLASRSASDAESDEDTSALMATNVQLERQLAASEALVRTLESESDGHRKAHEATVLEALTARSKVEQHVSDTEYSTSSGSIRSYSVRSLDKGRSRSSNSLVLSSAWGVGASIESEHSAQGSEMVQEVIQLKREREEALSALRASREREALKEREREDYELLAELAKVRRGRGS